MKNQSHLSDPTMDTVSGSLDSDKISEIISQLSGIKEKLSQISASTELNFVTLGNTLQQGHEEAMATQKKAVDIVSLTDGEEGKIALLEIKKRIRSSLDDLLEHRENIISQSLSVKTVMEHLQTLKTKNSDIGRLAKYLRAVALNIFIETSRSHVVSDNFSIIATEIKQLSETILALAKNIRENVDETGDHFSAIYHNIEMGIEQLENLTSEADHSVNYAVKQTDEWVDQARKTASYSVDINKTIIDKVGEIVMSLQFHDAMRQRLEHIGAGFDEMKALGQAYNQDDSQQRETLAMLYALSVAFSDQLDQIIQEIYGNYNRCTNAFEAVGQQMVQVGRGIRDLAGREPSNGRSGKTTKDSIGLLFEALSDFMTLQTRGGELVTQMDEAYTMVSQTSSSLSSQVGKIHQISLDAHIKSLNAIIAATHLGTDGKTLSVLAGEMKSLSDLTEIYVHDVNDIITNLLSGSIQKDTLEREFVEQDNSLEDIVQSVSHMVNQLKNEAGDMQMKMRNLYGIHKTAKQNLEFMPVMADDLKKQKAELDLLKDLFAPFWEKGTDTTKIHARLEERHTMQTERLIHKKSISGIHEKTDNEAQTEQDEDLGDNIELF